MVVGFEDRVTPWIDFDGYGVVAVRIWNRLTPFGMFQRHEWRHKDGLERADGWIPAAGRSWAKKAVPTHAEDALLGMTREELEHLVEHFAGANDPVARSILAKAVEALT